MSEVAALPPNRFGNVVMIVKLRLKQSLFSKCTLIYSINKAHSGKCA